MFHLSAFFKLTVTQNAITWSEKLLTANGTRLTQTELYSGFVKTLGIKNSNFLGSTEPQFCGSKGDFNM